MWLLVCSVQSATHALQDSPGRYLEERSTAAKPAPENKFSHSVCKGVKTLTHTHTNTHYTLVNLCGGEQSRTRSHYSGWHLCMLFCTHPLEETQTVGYCWPIFIFIFMWSFSLPGKKQGPAKTLQQHTLPDNTQGYTPWPKGTNTLLLQQLTSWAGRHLI